MLLESSALTKDSNLILNLVEMFGIHEYYLLVLVADGIVSPIQWFFHCDKKLEKGMLSEEVRIFPVTRITEMNCYITHLCTGH